MPTTLTKPELRERSLQLRDLLCAWDPIGVMPHGPRDEYDCLRAPLLRLLDSRAAVDEIGAYLRKEIVEHFGLSPAPYDFATVAVRLREWFDLGWRDPAEPVTILVALPDEGVDVWRPVQARPLERGLYRIVGVEADVSDERWQFPAGALVRCERRSFEDGTVAIAAVEQVAG